MLVSKSTRCIRVTRFSYFKQLNFEASNLKFGNFCIEYCNIQCKILIIHRSRDTSYQNSSHCFAVSHSCEAKQKPYHSTQHRTFVAHGSIKCNFVCATNRNKILFQQHLSNVIVWVNFFPPIPAIKKKNIILCAILIENESMYWEKSATAKSIFKICYFIKGHILVSGNFLSVITQNSKKKTFNVTF